MILDHPVIRYMERDGYLPKWMCGPSDDENECDYIDYFNDEDERVEGYMSANR